MLFDFALLGQICHFVFLTTEILREYACLVYHFQTGLALFIDYMIIFNSFTWDENFNSVCSNRGEVSPRFTVMKLLQIIAILFLHCFHLSCKMKSRHGLSS